MTNPSFARTYAGLCAKIADTLNRQDLAAIIPDFTVLATARLSRNLARMRHPKALTHDTSLVATGALTPAPSDFVAPYKLGVSNNPTYAPRLEFLSPDEVDALTPVQLTGPIRYYTLVGANFEFIPRPSSVAPANLDLWYFAALPGLDDTHTTNWLLSAHPDLYLYGSLVHSAPYLKDDARVQVWETMYQTILSEVELEAAQMTRPQSKLNAHARSFG